jgi:STE24 endopeptidase
MEDLVAGRRDHSGDQRVVRSAEHESLPRTSDALSFAPIGPGEAKGLAKHYSNLKLVLSLSQGAVSVLFLIIVLVAGWSARIESLVRGWVGGDYLVLVIFAVLLLAGEFLVTLPLRWYSGFVLEHRYRVSNQTFLRWAWEGMKAALVSVPLGIPLLLFLFYALRAFGGLWWLPMGIALFGMSVLLGRLAPVLIYPLFYKFKPLEDAALRERILELASRLRVKVRGVFVFDMSRNTKKANAAVTGIGTSKRILLGDNLIANLTDDEVEAVFAHEMGHYTMHHIWKLMLAGTAQTFVGLYLVAQAYQASLSWFGFTQPDTIAALPLLGLGLALFSLITGPLGNALSRMFERSADEFAWRVTNGTDALARALRKLATINIVDVRPHPIVEFLFATHPSVESRIRGLDSLRKRKEA